MSSSDEDVEEDNVDIDEDEVEDYAEDEDTEEGYQESDEDDIPQHHKPAAPAKMQPASVAPANMQPSTATAPKGAGDNTAAPAAQAAEGTPAQQGFNMLDEAMKGLVQGGFAGLASNLGNLGGGLSSLWGGGGNADREVSSTGKDTLASPGGDGSKAMQSFELSADEHIMETFACKLLQTYECRHNSFTPEIQMVFAGRLAITDKHTHFLIEERGKQLPFKLAHVMVKAVKQQSSGKASYGSDVLAIECQDGTALFFKDFASSGEPANAQALIQHLLSQA